MEAPPDQPVKCGDAEFRLIENGARLLIEKYDENDRKVEELTLTPDQFDFLLQWLNIVEKPKDESDSD